MFTRVNQASGPLSGVQPPPCFYGHWSVGQGFAQGTLAMSSLLCGVWSLSWEDVKAWAPLGTLTGHLHVAHRVAGL